MKGTIKLISIILGIFVMTDLADAVSPEEMLRNIHWQGKQASTKIIVHEKIIYIDPYEIADATKDGDIILLTHDHKDHLSLPDIAKVVKPDTVFVASRSCADSIQSEYKNNLILLEPWMDTTIGIFKIEAVPAYNLIKTKYHPKEKKYVGYIITVDGNRIYHTGDTERIPEMQKISCDIVLLPLGKTYTMNSVEEAAKAVLDVGALFAIPIHYGIYEGKIEDAYEFKKLLEEKVQVKIQKYGK